MTAAYIGNNPVIADALRQHSQQFPGVVWNRECQAARRVVLCAAHRALQAGLRIDPTASEGLFGRKTADYWFGDKITDPAKRQHLFYRQSMLFVGYLRTTDEAHFRKFMLRVQDGGDFTESVGSTYGKDLNELWQQFLNELPPP